MSLKVGELHAVLRLDDGQFNTGLDGSKGRFEGLKNVVSTGVKTMATAFAGVTTVAAGLGVAAFKVGKDFNVLQQNSRSALTTILGSAEAAADQMDRLDDFASNSPFARQVWITAQQQLLGFGVEAERVVPIMDAIQQSVAAVGGGNEQIEQITYALAQMQGTGRLTGQTLNQLGQYGIDAASIIGERMGKTGEEIRKMATSPGGIPVDQVWDPLVDGLMDRFDGATDGLRQQWDGAVDRIKAAWRDIGSIIAEPFIDPMGGGRAVDWANDFADTLRAAQAKIRPFVDILVDRLAPGMDRITPAFQSAQGAINSWDLSRVNSQLDEFGRYAPLIAGTATALFTLGAGSLPILSQLGFAGINPVLAGFAALVAFSPELRQLGTDFLSGLQPLLPVLRDVGITLADELMGALHTLVPAFGELLGAVMPVATGLITSLAPAMVGVIQQATPLVGLIADIVGWMAELPTWAIAGAGAFLMLQGPIRTVATQAATMFRTLREQAAVQAALGGTTQQMGLMGAAAVNAGRLVHGLGVALRGALVATGIGLAIAGISAAIGFLVQRQQEAAQAAREHEQQVQTLTDILRQSNGVIDETVRQHQVLALEQNGALSAAEALGIGLDDVADAALGTNDALLDYLGTLIEAGTTTERVAGMGGTYRDVMDESATSAMDLRDSILAQRGALTDAESALRRTERAQGDAKSATDAHNDAIKEQQDLLREAADATLGQAEALSRQEDAQDRTREALENLNEVTEDAESSELDLEQARRRVDDALIAEARSNLNLIDAMQRNNASTSDLRTTTLAARDAFIESAMQMGHTRREANDLADAYGLIPPQVRTTIHASGFAEATRQVSQWIRNNSGQRIFVDITPRGSSYRSAGWQPGQDVAEADGGVLSFYRNGGMRESHVAQIAPAGAWRVWAEPETGGEAYIPLAAGKRARSLAILDEVAQRFGRVTIPTNVTRHAEGSVSHAPSAPVSRDPMPQVTVMVQAYPDGPWVRQQARVVFNDEHSQAMAGGM